MSKEVENCNDVPTHKGNVSNLKKLVTHEDPYHIHKLLGIISLLNFVYQTIMMFYLGKLYRFPIWACLPNVTLPITSFMFTVLPKKRPNGSMGLFIWKEMRLHVLVFSSRGMLSAVFPEYGPVICLATMVAADTATYFYGTRGVTTLRSDHKIPATPVERVFRHLYATSQFGATVICSGLFQPQVTPILAFMTVLPIQSSAFLMTLVRKNIIGPIGWNVIYSAQLLLLYVMWYTQYQNIRVFLVGSVVLMLRPHMSKYTIWTAMYMLHTLMYQS